MARKRLAKKRIIDQSNRPKITLRARNISNSPKGITYSTVGFKIGVNDIATLSQLIPAIGVHKKSILDGDESPLTLPVCIVHSDLGLLEGVHLSLGYNGPRKNDGGFSSVQCNICITDDHWRAWLIKNAKKDFVCEIEVTDRHLLLLMNPDTNALSGDLELVVRAPTPIGISREEAIRRGWLGEQLAADIIKSRFRRLKVIHHSLLNPLAPYDFLVTSNGSPHRYVEVKSTTRADSTVIISFGEVEFRKQNVSQHSILIVTLSPGGKPPVSSSLWLDQDQDFRLQPMNFLLSPANSTSHLEVAS